MKKTIGIYLFIFAACASVSFFLDGLAMGIVVSLVFILFGCLGFSAWTIKCFLAKWLNFQPKQLYIDYYKKRHHVTPTESQVFWEARGLNDVIYMKYYCGYLFFTRKDRWFWLRAGTLHLASWLLGLIMTALLVVILFAVVIMALSVLKKLTPDVFDHHVSVSAGQCQTFVLSTGCGTNRVS